MGGIYNGNYGGAISLMTLSIKICYNQYSYVILRTDVFAVHIGGMGAPIPFGKLIVI